MKKVVIFGPWCGEFSYELSWWNPGIRKIRNEDFKDYESVHIGFKGRRAMYKDFIDDYISYPKELEQILTNNNFKIIFEWPSISIMSAPFKFEGFMAVKND